MQNQTHWAKRAAVLTGIVVVFMGSGAPLALAKEDEKVDAGLKAQAKVTEPQAIATAERHISGGKAKDAELEMENGSLIYSVEVAGAGKTFEVNIDASSGKVLNSHEEKVNQNDENDQEADHEDGGKNDAD